MSLFLTRKKMKSIAVMLSLAVLLVVAMEITESRRLVIPDSFEDEQELAVSDLPQEEADYQRPLKRCKDFGGCVHDWDCCQNKCYYGHC